MQGRYVGIKCRFPSNPLRMKVPFLPLFCFNKETLKGKKGTTRVPRSLTCRHQQ